MNMRPWLLAVGLMASVVGTCEAAPKPKAGNGAVPTYTYQRIVDTATNIPNGTGKFSGFYVPSISGGQVAFRAYGQNGPDLPVGIYRRSPGGPLEIIADKQTNSPGGPKFAGFQEPVIHQGDVVFGGAFSVDGSIENLGVYRHRAGVLSTLADTSSTVAGTDTQFTEFRGYAYANGELAFIAQGIKNQVGFDGLFRVPDGGGPMLIADTNTSIPGNPSAKYWLFQSVPAFYGSSVAFSADNNFQAAPMSGVFLANGTALSTVLNTPYSFYRSLSASPQRLSFCVYDSAIYQLRNGQLTQPVITYRDRLPNSALPVTTIGASAVSGDALAYTGTFQISFTIPTPLYPLLIEIPIQAGLYADFGSGWETVVAMGNTLDGQRVRRITFSQWSFDGTQFAFRVDFSDGSEAIYVATRSSP